MASNHSPLRRSPTQSRAAATLKAIREAALRILKQEGHARLTTNRIAEVAGISIGSLYQYYSDKHAIAADICNELLTSELDEINRLDRQTIALAKDSLDATLAFFVEEHVARHRRLYLQLLDFYLEIHWKYDFESYSLKRYPDKPTTTAWLPSALKRHHELLRVTDYALAAQMVVNALEGTIHATLDRNPELILTQGFIDELHAMLVRYLTKLPVEGSTND
ncbi:TetR/AcrR family transcriptional regulator [Thauera sp. 2A1]|uniref:TetR/AcrR family transcriptional regulator n=1 Tax=Thauera sp. 2A1 TaxID=2570191 RepID=UPI001290E9E9|nr:TetR/AcrR family transcriptional regulator [Thauera sp. 2A1]KAI5914038.1 TetR/AcrR family transcriptional regulator [Thauera sp. 2A1]